MSKYDYDTSTTNENEEPIYLSSSSDDDDNVVRYTDGPEPISDEEMDDNRRNEDEDEDDEDAYIPTSKPGNSSYEESDQSDTDEYDEAGPGGIRHRPIKVYDEYDPENLDNDFEDEMSPDAKFRRALKRGRNAAQSSSTRSSILISAAKPYQVPKSYIYNIPFLDFNQAKIFYIK